MYLWGVNHDPIRIARNEPLWGRFWGGGGTPWHGRKGQAEGPKQYPFDPLGFESSKYRQTTCPSVKRLRRKSEQGKSFPQIPKTRGKDCLGRPVRVEGGDRIHPGNPRKSG